jgi:DNA repair exonuclease SbcCD ATPase subunit
LDRIKINELRVKGVRKDYFVNFESGLNIISGEISTGKTSILELIDYCLGHSNHPRYPEIARNGNITLLEIEINNQTYTIARQLFTNRQKAFIHSCKISELTTKHDSIEVNSWQKKGEASISSFILSKIKLGGIPLKEAPSKDSSDVDTMSFRDIMWFCFMERERIGGKNLVFEKDNFMKRLKMIQVFDVIFDLHSKRLALLSAESDKIDNEIKEKQSTEKMLISFVEGRGILTVPELNCSKNRLNEEIQINEIKLREIDGKIAGNSDISKGLQETILKLRAELEEVRVRKRDNEKTLLRLMPLRADYNEEIRKLTFLQEAKKIFDPLTVVLCPVCLCELETHSTEKKQDICPLCKRDLQKEKEIVIDLSGEIRSNERKLNELAKYIMSLEEKNNQIEKQEKELTEKLSSAGQKLDATLRTFVSPYLTERENIISLISTNKNEIKHVDDDIETRESIERITQEILKLQAEQEQVTIAIESERRKSTNRIELIQSLSKTYFNQLKQVNYPKLEKPDEAWIDEKLNPFVRKQHYSDASSDGAINLASICWFTAIFYEAIKRSMHHPGFLMIDSVQSGIGVGDNIESDFRDQKIVQGLYQLLEESATIDRDCQLIVVDNHPPTNMKKHIRVYYSGKANTADKYGFIDDETG